MTSQPETELNTEELNEDTAVLEQLARKREQAGQQEGAESEDQEEQQNEAEEAEEEATGEVEDDDPEIDLGEIKAKKSEILAWKQGEMKEADYRQKTAAVAEAKRQAQALQERVEQERSHYANQLDALIGQLQTELVGDQQALAQLAQENPAEWVRQNVVHQQRFQRLQQALGERQAIEQRTRQEAESKKAEWIRSQMEVLREKLPHWRDQAVMLQELNDVDAFLRRTGVEDGDMEKFLDHRIYLLARNAWQAEKRESARAALKDKQVKQPPPKAIKAGSAQPENKASHDAYKEAQKRARSGKEEDLMALLAAKRRNA
jgi:hypothetical protein